MAQASFQSIWRGDVSKVAAARREYDPLDPHSFFPYASALYSFWFIPWYRKELIRLIAVRGEAQRDFLMAHAKVGFSRFADQCDMLITYLLRVSEYADAYTRMKYRGWAWELCRLGDKLAEPFKKRPEHAHTWCLIQLHQAELLLLSGDIDAAQERLDDVALVACHEGAIGDVNQLVRVLAKLARLTYTAGRPRTARRLAKAARSKPGATLFVRMKAWVTSLGLVL